MWIAFFVICEFLMLKADDEWTRHLMNFWNELIDWLELSAKSAAVQACWVLLTHSLIDSMIEVVALWWNIALVKIRQCENLKYRLKFVSKQCLTISETQTSNVLDKSIWIRKYFKKFQVLIITIWFINNWTNVRVQRT